MRFIALALITTLAAQSAFADARPNTSLSEARAEAVRELLSQETTARVENASSQPVQNSNEERGNRRVEIKVITQ